MILSMKLATVLKKDLMILLSEYYARGFEEYVYGNRKFIAKTSPALFNVLEELFKEEE